MRKFFAGLLAVLMIAGLLSALPAFAEKSTVDGTVAADYDEVDLVITEVMVNSKSNVGKYNEIEDYLSNSKTYSYDCFDYIEIYNRGDEPVNLYEYSLLRRANYSQAGSKAYETERTFDRKNYITPGSIYNESYGVYPSAQKEYSQVQNPPETDYDPAAPASEQLHYLLPGQFAVIWFWTAQCDTVSTNNQKSMAAPNTALSDGENAYYFPEFRNFYNVPDETVVLAVYAQNNAANAMFSFDLANYNAHMYALAHECDENGERDPFQLYEAAFTLSGGLNEKIESLFCWGVNTRAGIPTSDGMDGYATNYMPPVATPHVYQAEQAQYGAVDTSRCYDYVQIGHSLSYKEMAIFRYRTEPTVGSMPLYQWAYVDPQGLVNHLDALYSEVEGEIPEGVKNLISDYDEVVEYRIYETDDNGEVVTDAEGNPVETDLPLLLDADTGKLLTDIVNGEYIWQTRVIERATRLMACVLADVPAHEEVQREVHLVKREELYLSNSQDGYNTAQASQAEQSVTEITAPESAVSAWPWVVAILSAALAVLLLGAAFYCKKRARR